LTNAVHAVSNVFLSHIESADKRPGFKELYSLSRLLEHHVYESDTLLVFKASV
jgi:hypothetical protein